MTKIIPFLIFIHIILTSSNAICIPADVTDISNRDYTDAVVKILDNSKESIYMVMYLISFTEGGKGNSVYRLMEALKNAHKRDVVVKVILDYRSSVDMEEGAVSYYAYKFLKVSLKAPDNPKRTFKYVIGILKNQP